MIRNTLPRKAVSASSINPIAAPTSDRHETSEAGKRIVGEDLGFVQTKAVWGSKPEERCKFGSLVKRRSEAATEGVEDSEGYLVDCSASEDDHMTTWNVGSKGVYDFSAERLTNESDLPKLLTTFGLMYQRTAHSYIDLLVSGLPVEDFKTYREPFGESLKGSFHFGFNGSSVHINVKDVLIMPQSAGAYYDFAMDDNGKMISSPLLSEDTLVWDMGGKTSDGCIMEKSKYSQDSFTIYQGVWKVQNELRRIIAKKFRYTMHPAEVDGVLRSKVLMLAGKAVDVSEQCTLAVETVFPTVRDEISLHIADFRRFSALLLAGGGSYLFQDYMEEYTGIPTILLPDAEYSNANGYRKYGMFKTNR